MNTQDAYNKWADQYDTNLNATRDLEAVAMRTVLADLAIRSCLEVGCGTGKNTGWLLEKGMHVTGVDLSEAMLAKAREKISSDQVSFLQADITTEWTFTQQRYDLITFSLVLEHIEDLDFIFEQVNTHLNADGYVYIGELHPFKQYTGSKARFDTAEGTHIVTCFNHHISEFLGAAKKQGLKLVELQEYFDEHQTGIPRILSLLFKK